MPIGVLQGDQALIAKLRALGGRKATQAIDRALKAGAGVVKPAMQSRIAKRRGVAARSIKVGRVKRRKKGSGQAWQAFADPKVILREIARRKKRRRRTRASKGGRRSSDYYPAYLEYKNPKQPWRGPAFQASKGQAAAVIKRSLKTDLKRIAAAGR